jgi:hypothetical protein
MKKIAIVPMLIAFAMICSCQKQDSTAEQQLAQRKAELDTHENALDEREKELNLRETGLNERENALAKREKAAANSRTIPTDAESHGTSRDPAQLKAERDKKIQQLPPDVRALIPDPSQMNSAKVEKDRMAQERLPETQRGPEQLQSQRQRKFEAIQKWQISGATVSPAAEAAAPTAPSALEASSPTPSLPVDATSPTPSPALEVASPTPSPTPQ